MIPSVIGAQARRGIEEFLRTTFPITNPFFEGVLDELLARPGEVFRGPYISLKLPFETAVPGSPAFFRDVLPSSFRPFRHQEQAWQRLDYREGRNTIIATGTGSGKTECFLYPLLDYCYAHRNERGIKAILIYPMNALATDQGRRIAQAIYNSPALRGRVTAGLYVGEEEREPKVAMTEASVITHKESMRQAPPDILLTNYKMLDYLLVRPDDLPLWRRNGPETLRYVVIDELHTFDGAQGADVACLLRRVRERLQAPPKRWICVGTSATLASDGAQGPTESAEMLADYATRVFGEPFEKSGVVGESVQSPETFLSGEKVLYAGVPGPEAGDVLDPLRYTSRDEYLQAQRLLWFGTSMSAPGTDAWALELARQLRSHGLLRRLLTITGPRATDAAELCERLQAALPGFGEAGPRYVEQVLASFLALISAARIPSDTGSRPLIQVRYQFWMRELARVVASVGSKPRLGFASDLKAEELRRSLPVVHCRECGLTGWAGTIPDASERVNPDLDTFYRAFFKNRPEVHYLFPGDDLDPSGQASITRWLCPECLNVQTSVDARECSWCGKNASDLLRVWVPDITFERTGKDGTVKWFSSHNCPACDGKDSLTVVGSRASSLTSVLISQLFASPFNPGDKKLLAFSDNVQDASHRAGFFRARTFRFNLRAAIQRIIPPGQPVPLLEVASRFFERWESEWANPAEFVVRFLPPDMEWLEEFERLRRDGFLALGSPLLPRLRKRLEWEIWSEYTHSARIGRSLEKTGCSVAEPRPDRFEPALEAVTLRLRNEIGGLHGVSEEAVRRFLHGFLLNLKNRGGVWYPDLDAYVSGLGDWWTLLKKGERHLYMPARLARPPVFLMAAAPGVKTSFLPILSGSTSAPSWQTEWLRRCFGAIDPHIADYTLPVYRAVLKDLVKYELMVETPTHKGPVWGVAGDGLQITDDVRQLRCDRCSFLLSVGPSVASALIGGRCPHRTCQRGVMREIPPVEDYYGRLYRAGEVARIFATEHTGLLSREVREAVESGFKDRRKPGDPNLLSCTPTLEMGVDIGDLETVAMCSAPPRPSNYLQRAGRAGRKHGNAFITTVANAEPHDLFFFVRPAEMLEGQVEPPGCFLNASAVLERQFTAFILDRWVEGSLPAGSLPGTLAQVLESVEKGGPAEAFPWNFLAFLELHRTSLENRFLLMFGEEVSEWTRERLLEFSRGEEGLRYRLVDGLKKRAEELKKWRARISTLNKRIRELADTPMEAKQKADDESELRQEKAALRQLVNDLRDLRVLNFLTDEGLLPNYAFPEQGVILQSIIFRKKSNEPDVENQYDTHTYKYERPAAAAIAELAPSSSFYAEGRKVQIDGVIFEPEDLQPWRLCPNCSYMQLDDQEQRSACPKCAHPLWSDDGQRRTLLRMKQVMSNTSDRQSRSFDDTESREPHFFEKNMFVVGDDADIAKAYFLDHEDVPFGFEFFRTLTLREVNFGEGGSGGAQITVAGRERTARSFELCEACGKVRRNGEIQHTPWCRYRKDPDHEKSVRACYLYREFRSEAIRMLLPVSAIDWQRDVESFVAALQLGLKKQFHGDPGHLHTTVYDEPIEGTEARKRYLVLYDGVPGGTGYLKTLMVNPAQLHEVFRKAHEALVACDCRLDDTKDGCYACLLAYRGRHFQGRTSRTAAIDLLGRILKHWDSLKETERLANVRLNRLLESELEAAFLEALERNSPGEPERRLEPRVVNGKRGYYLNFVKHGAWLVEPQVDLGPDTGVRVSSRADFVLYPQRPVEGELPVVVFTDGYEWHAEPNALRTGLDTAQRLAIVRSGRYRVWSLAWADVHERLKKTGDVSVPSAFDGLVALLSTKRGTGLSDGRPPVKGLKACVGKPEQLAQALTSVGPVEWPPTGAALAAASGVGTQPAGWLCGSADTPWMAAFAAAPRDVRVLQRFWVRLYDERADGSAEWKNAWREFLRITNLLQFLPDGAFFTSTGLRDGVYGSLLDSASAGEEPPAFADVLDEEARTVAAAVETSGAVRPEVGYEIADEEGEIVAVAELAWPDLKICVMTKAQEEYAEAAKALGWKVLGTGTAVIELLPKRDA